MQSAFQLIEKVMIDKLSSAPASLGGVESIKQFLCVLTFSFMTVALVFLVYGTHTWLSVHYDEGAAAILTSAISFAVSAIIVGILYALICYHKMRIKKVQEKIVDKIRLSLSALEDELGDPIRENPQTALMIALFLGFIAKDQIFE